MESRIYNRTTKELFGRVSFISPLSLLKNINSDVRIKRINYFYVFPQRCYTWHHDDRYRGSVMYKAVTSYWWLIWKMDVVRVRDTNLRRLNNE